MGHHKLSPRHLLDCLLQQYFSGMISVVIRTPAFNFYSYEELVDRTCLSNATFFWRVQYDIVLRLNTLGFLGSMPGPKTAKQNVN